MNETRQFATSGPPLRVRETADGQLIEIRTYFPFRPKGKHYGPSVVEQLRAAKTPDEVHRILGDHLKDHVSARARRLKNAAAAARLARLRTVVITGAA